MNNDIRFLYLREESTNPNGKGFPVACICLRVDRNSNSVSYGISTVHPKDKLGEYNRALARELAFGRMALHKKMITLPRGEYHNMHDITWMVFDQLATDKTIPKRAQKAMTRWLSDASIKDFRIGTDLAVHKESPAYDLYGT